MPGPTLRTDIVDVYVFRRNPAGVASFLQLHRCAGALSGTWQPVMGHAIEGESAVTTALRELHEETGYAPRQGLLNLWQLETPNVYFLASHDALMISPCFAAEVAADSEPRLNEEHDAHRWIARDHVDRHFLWPGQRQAVAQIVRDVLEPESPIEPILRQFPPA